MMIGMGGTPEGAADDDDDDDEQAGQESGPSRSIAHSDCRCVLVGWVMRAVRVGFVDSTFVKHCVQPLALPFACFFLHGSQPGTKERPIFPICLVLYVLFLFSGLSVRP
jgi:hypothetical protein